jgi:hypothetical protein
MSRVERRSARPTVAQTTAEYRVGYCSKRSSYPGWYRSIKIKVFAFQKVPMLFRYIRSRLLVPFTQSTRNEPEPDAAESDPLDRNGRM